ncbi:MAG TPA: xanthine dehydrogenase family protein molybdopterin-binding subunit [Xanthobacteraceae bacterium]|nr:xanthine dehydrogenase family protein molybdopterin-binding subunit [Xanthobacteraceae bacterium]
MTKSATTAGIGRPVIRKEDAYLVAGQGRFSDDLNLPGQAYAVMVRSPHSHARIRAIDTTAAITLPGVLAILTGADALADGLKPIPHRPIIGPPDVTLGKPDASDKFISPHRVLPHDKARFAGEAVAMVVAESIATAKDAAERVTVDYESLPAVIDSVAAAANNAPRLWEEAGSNVCIDAQVGDAAATEAAFARATHVVRLDTWVQRVTGVPLEPRAAVGSYDPVSGRTTLYAGSGGVVRQKNELAVVLGVPPERVRVVSGDVGGNFGTRNAFYPEFALVAWAARRIGRPVKWTCERQEAFLSDFQGRDLFVNAELALDGEGNFLALRGANLSNVGAHTVSFVPLTKGISVMSSVYRIPAASFRARAVMSNTPPTNPYRSAGRPEAMFVIERLIDLAAANHGFDRVELRRRNLVTAHEMPYANPLGLTYDSGDYQTAMDAALALGQWDGFAQRRTRAVQVGKRRGIAIANYVEFTTGAPREWTKVSVLPDGRVDVAIGTLSSGQGHQTSFAQLVVDWLGVPFDCVKLIQGDTDVIPIGGGSHSGRSMRLAGIVIGKAADAVIARGKRIAAHVLEAAEHDIEFAAGRFTVKGTDRTLDIFDAARAAMERNELPDDLRGPLAAEGDETVKVGGCPYGSHVCEVEIDPDLGTVEIVSYAAVDDVGRAVNPRILHGQTHGAIAQGVGQALLEGCVYDRGSGQLLSGSFMDYAIPRAHDLLSFATEISEVPSPTNPLGVRAGGEGGTTPALAVVVNAVVDALAEFGVKHMEMPVTPERVWRETSLRTV